MITWVFFLSLLVWHITLIDFGMLYQLCISGVSLSFLKPLILSSSPFSSNKLHSQKYDPPTTHIVSSCWKGEHHFFPKLLELPPTAHLHSDLSCSCLSDIILICHHPFLREILYPFHVILLSLYASNWTNCHHCSPLEAREPALDNCNIPLLCF